MTFPEIYQATFIQKIGGLSAQRSAAGIFKKWKALDISLIIYHCKVFASLTSRKGI